MAAKRDRLGREGGKTRNKTGAKPTKPPLLHLGIESLEQRSLLAVTSSLNAGLLDVAMNAASDSASISLVNEAGQDKVDVFDGSTHVKYLAAGVAGLNVHGNSAANQSLQLHSALKLGQALTVSQIASTTIDGAYQAASAVIQSGQIHLNGGTISTRTIAPGGDPNTALSTGNSGSISLTGTRIDSTPGAKLLAQATGVFNPGSVKINATDTQSGNSAVASAVVSFNAVTIKGGDISIQSNASVSATVNNPTLNLANIGVGSTATVTLSGASVVNGSGNVLIATTSNANTTANVAAQSNNTDTAVDAAVARTSVTGTAVTHLADSTNVTAGGLLTISAGNNAVANAVADGTVGGSNAGGATVAYTSMTMDTEAFVDAAASLNAGQIRVTAASQTSTNTAAKATVKAATANSAATASTLAQQNAKTANGPIAIAAAVGIANVNDKTLAYLASSAPITASGDLQVGSTSGANIVANADAGAAANGGKVTGEGVAVAVNHSNESNKAYIGGTGLVSAKGIGVTATSPVGAPNAFTAQATSGISKKNSSVSGAAAFDIATVGDEAFLAAGSNVNPLGGDLLIRAVGDTSMTATAQPAPGANPNSPSKGIGASVAVDILGDTTRAEMEDGSNIVQSGPTPAIKNLTVSANAHESMTTSAQSGADPTAAGTTFAGYSSAVGINLLNAVTNARVGSGGATATSGGLSVAATHKAEVSNIDGGNNAGQGVLGAAFALSVTDSKTNATTVRDLNIGGDASIATQADLVTGADASSSGRGGRTSSGNSVDTEALAQLAFANNQAAGSGAPGTNAAPPKAATGNGSVSVAGAIAMNLVTSSTSEATVAAGEKLTVGGAVTVGAANDTDAHARADGSTAANNATGVGIAVAIDAVSNATDKADILPGAVVKAKAVTLSAGMSKTGDQTDVIGASSASGVSATQTGVAGSVAINVSKFVTEAQVALGASVDAGGGDLVLSSASKVQSNVDALPALAPSNAAKGVGLSFGLNVVEDDSTASLQANSVESNVKNLNLAARTDDTLKTTVQTGLQATNSAFGAAVGISTLTAPTTASIAENLASPIAITGDASLAATHAGSVSTSAGGQLQIAPGTAIGASVAVSVEKVDTVATVGRNLSAQGNLALSSTNNSAGSAVALASVKGGKADDGSSPQTAADDETKKDLAQADSAASSVGAAGTNGAKAPKAQSDSGGVSAAGAVAVNIVAASRSEASIAPGKVVSSAKAVGLSALNDTDSLVRADGSSTQSGSTGIGVAVAIDAATGVSTRAVVGAGAEVDAKSLSLTTGMSPAGDGVNTLSADASSGAGASQTGIAGALAINIGKVDTESLVDAGAKVNLVGGDLALVESQTTKAAASAVPTKDQVFGTDKGIGVSAAFNYLDDTGVAEIADGATVAGAKGVVLSAGTFDTMTTNAETGSQSSNGLAASASLAASILNANTRARIGADKAGGAGLDASGDIDVEAAHVDNVTTSAGGTGQGATKSIGIAIGFGFENVNTVAVTDRDLSGGAVTFGARSASATNTTAVASAVGAKDASGPGNGTNQQANSTVAGLDSKATDGGVKGTGGTTVPDAKTSNGDSVAVAGALAIDIVGHSLTSASIPDGRKVNAKTGVLSLSAQSDLDAASKADGSAKTDGTTGAGVAVAITVAADDQTLANIGRGDRINAKGVKLSAGMSGYNDQTNVVGASAISGASASEKAGAGGLALSVFLPKTQASILDDPLSPTSTSVDAGSGSVSLSASETTRSTVSATPAKDLGTGKSLGVGLSFGFNIVEQDTRAEVQDKATVANAGDVSLTANSDDGLSTKVSAGATATGGTGVAASGGASAETSTTVARWGANSNLIASGDISLSATHRDSVKTEVGADAKGTETTVGAAVAFTYEKVNTVATTDSDLTAAGAVRLAAHNASSTAAVAIGSATGAADKSAGGSATGARDQGEAAKNTLGSNAKSAAPNAQGVDPSATVPDAKTSNGKSIAVAGAIAVDLPLQVHSTATIPDGRRVTAQGGPLQLSADNDLDASSVADGTAKGDATTGVGVAVALTIAPDDLTAATIGKNDVINAKGVQLSATMSPAGNLTNVVGAVATSGASASEKAGAGALGLVVFLPKTQATIDASSVNAGGGALSLTAAESTKSTVAATPAKDLVTGKSLGVGVSFGFDIVESDTRAEIKDGAAVGNVGAVTLAANSRDILDTKASAGAAATGGDAWAASGAASALTSTTTARIGALPNAALQSGAVNVTADHVDVVGTSAGGDAKGTETTVGAAIAFTYEKVNTIAVTDRDINASGSVSFASHNASSSSAGASASATGASDNQGGNAPNGAHAQGDALKDSLGSNEQAATSNGQGVDPSAKTTDAKTSNGDSVAFAGAIAVDLPLQVHSTASVPAGRSITSTGALSLEATNDVDAVSNADGTAKGDATTGVGVAFAVTVAVDDLTEANIGSNAHVDAHGVSMSAGMSAAGDGVNTVGAAAVSGASASDKAGAGALGFSIFLPKTRAIILDNASVNAELGDVSASAKESTASTVSAKPSIDGVKGKTLGVGISAAFNIVETETRAEIANGAVLNGPQAGFKPHDVLLSADSKDLLTTDASSGVAAAGGQSPKAIAGSVGVSVLDARTDATIGTGSPLATSGAISLNANHSDSLVTTVGADAKSDATAVGISIGFTYEKVGTITTTNRDLNAAGAIGFTTHNDSRTKTVSHASGAGGQDVGGANSQHQMQDQGNAARDTTNSNAAAASNGAAQGIDGSASVPDAKNGDGKSVAVSGALAFNLPLAVDVEATIPAARSITAGGDLSLEALNHVDAIALADGTAVGQATTGVGVAVAMSIVPSDQTLALIGDHDVITAKGVSLKAGMINGLSNTIQADAVSGASASEKAGSGAFAFDLFLADTHAIVGDHATISGSGDDLALWADESTTSTVNAKPSISNGQGGGGGNPGTHDGGVVTGVGVAVALNIVQVDTRAEVDPVVGIAGVKDVLLDAHSDDVLWTKAQSGISLANANSSDVYGGEFAVSFLKAATDAAIDAGGSLNAAHDVKLDATHSDVVSTIADGYGNGTGDSVGIAIGFTYDDARTTAETHESITAGNVVSLNADNATGSDTKAISSVTGGKDKDANTANNQTDLEGNKARGLADDYSTQYSGDATGATSTPSAKTSDGNISVAGALAINIVGQSRAIASTEPGKFVHTNGPLSVTAQNDTDALAGAYGQGTSAGTTGVGVAVALNIAPSVETTARIGTNSDIQAKGVNVAAGMSSSNNGDNSVGADALSGASASQKAGAGGFGFNLFLNHVTAEIGAGSAVHAKNGDTTVTADSVTDAAATALPTMKGNQTQGVGISVAVDIVEDTVSAAIPDTVQLFDPNALTVAASSHTGVTSHAEAGTTSQAGGQNSSTGAGAAAVNVAISNTSATIGTGNAVVAGGNVKVAASHTGDTSAAVSANSVGTDTVVGVGIGVNVDVINTTSDIHRNIAAGGSFEVSAHSNSNASATGAASAHGVGSGGGGQKTVDQQVSAERDYANDTLSSFGGTQDNSGGQTSPQTSQGKVDFAAAVGVDIVHMHSKAIVPDGLTLSAGGPFMVSAWNGGDAKASADGSAAGNAKTGIGVAVAVNYVDAEGIASVGNDAITSKGFVVESMLGEGVNNQQFHAEATSGAGGKKTGVAGAVALNLILDSKHDATVASGADIDAGNGDVRVQASTASNDSARAVPHDGGGQGSDTGVGASVAVNILVQEAHARIEDNAKLKNAGKFTVAASSLNDITTEARNGAQGQTAVGISAAVLYDRNEVQAYVGLTSEPGSLHAAGNATVSADARDVSTMTSNSVDIGKDTAVGVAIGVAILDTDESARLRRSLSSDGKIEVVTSDTVKNTNTAKAASVGVPIGPWTADSLTSNMTDYTNGLSGENFSNSNANVAGNESDASGSANSNTGASGNSSTGVAAVVAVNVEVAKMTAEVAPGLTLSANGPVTIGTISETDSLADAEGAALTIGSDTTSATASVAVNVAVIDNHVDVGNGVSITGNGIVIRANESADPGPQVQTSNDFMAQALAGSGGTSGDSGAGSAAINYLDVHTLVNVGNVTLNSGGGISVTAENPMTMGSLAGSLALSNGKGVGVAVAIDVVHHDTKATIGDGSHLDAVKGIAVTSSAGIAPLGSLGGPESLGGGLVPKNITGVAIGVAASTDTTIGGSVLVDDVHENTFAEIGKNSVVNANAVGGLDQSVTVHADDFLNLGAAVGGLAISGGTGVGFGLIVEVVHNDTHATIGAGTNIKAGGDVSATAESDDSFFGLCLLAGIASDNAVAISVEAFVPEYHTTASIGSNATVNAGGNVIVAADHDLKVELYGGSLSIGGSNGGGAQVVTMPLHETTEAYIGSNSTVTSQALTPAVAVPTGEKDAQGNEITQLVGGVDVQAVAYTDVTTLAAGGAASGGVSGSGSVVVDDEHVKTLAHIDSGARIYATNGPAAGDASIHLLAANPSTYFSLAGALAAGSSAGIGLGVDIVLVDKDTEAWSDAALMAAENDIVIKANSSEDLLSIAGSIAGGGSVAVGGSASISVFNVTTRAFLGYDPTNPDAVPGTNAAIALGNIQIAARESSSFIAIDGNVTASGTASIGVGAVVPIVTKTTEAFIGRDAQVLALGFGNAVDADTGNFIVQMGATQYPSQMNSGSTLNQHRDNIDGKGGSTPDSDISNRRSTVFETAPIHGLAVTAVNRDELILVGANAGVAGTAAINATGAVNVLTNHTQAHVDTGARINDVANITASPDQSVRVAAGNDFSYVGIAAGIAVSGSVGVALSGTVMVVNETTLGFVDDGATVKAERDITVGSHASENILTVAGSIAGAIGVSAAVGASVVVVNDTTLAYIGNAADSDAAGAEADAGGNVTIAASDRTKTLSIAGALSVGLAGGIGASVGVTVFNKNTRAFAGNHATINAAGNSDAINVYDGTNNKGAFGVDKTFRGLSIEASSTQEIFQLGASVAGGIYAGAAGGVSIELFGDTTQAYIGKNAHVNNHPSGTDRLKPYSVEVAATNTVKDFSLGGAVGVGAVGLAGGVDVGILRDNTSAYIDDGADVRALGDINVFGLSSEDIQTYGISASGGLGALAGSVSVWSIGSDYNTGYSHDGENDDALHSGSKDTGTDDVTRATDSTDDAGNQFSTVAPTFLDPSKAPGLNNVKHTNTNSVKTKTNNSLASNAQGGQVKGAIANPGTAGTSAEVHDGVKLLAAHDISVRAHDHLAMSIADGTVAVGFVGLGGAVAVVNIQSHVNATLGQNDVVEAGGDLSLVGILDNDVDGFVLSGTGGLVAGGANVLVVHDSSTQDAGIGDGTAVNRARNIDVQALALRHMHADTVSVAGGGLAVGITYVDLRQTGHTKATIGDGVQIGAAFGKQVTGGLFVLAGANNAVDAQGYGFSVGAISGAVNDTSLKVTPTIAASIGKNTTVLVGGGIELDAFSFGDASAKMLNVSAGIFSVNVMIAKATVSPIVTAHIGGDSHLEAGTSIHVSAQHNYDATGKPTLLGAHTDANAPGGGGISGTGVSTDSEANASTVVLVDAGTGLSGSAVTFETKLANNADSNSEAFSIDLVGAGISESTSHADGNAITQVDADAVIASSITVTAETTNSADAKGMAVGIGLGNVLGGDVTATSSPLVGALVGSLNHGTDLFANGNVRIAAEDISNAKATGFTGGGSIAFSVGQVKSTATDSPTVLASVGADSKVGSSFGSIIIAANHNSRGVGGATADSYAPSAGGFAAINGSEARADASAKVTARVSPAAVLDAGGNIGIGADATNIAIAHAHTVSFAGAAAVGSVLAQADAKGSTKALLDGSVTRGANLGLFATGTDTANAISEATAGGGLFAGNGATAEATVSPTLQTRIGDGQSIKGNSVNVNGSVFQRTDSTTSADAESDTTTISGLFGWGTSTADAVSAPTVLATVGDFAKVFADNGINIAAYHNQTDKMDAHAKTEAPFNFGGFASVTGMAPTAISAPRVETSIGDRVILGAGHDIDLDSENTSNVSAECDAVSISLGGAVGVGKATARVMRQLAPDNVTLYPTALTVFRGVIGSAENVTIEAHGRSDANSHGSATDFAIGAGIAGVTSIATIDTKTLAVIGDQIASGSIQARGDVSVLADDNVHAAADSATTAGAIVGVGISHAEATATPEIGAYLHSGSIRAGGDVFLGATLNLDPNTRTAEATAQSPGGGIISGNGAESTATAKPNIYAGSDKQTVIDATGNLTVDAGGTTIAEAHATSETIGGLLGIGASKVLAEASPTINALVLGKTTKANNLSVSAHDVSRAFTDGQASGGGAVSAQGVTVTSTVDPTTRAQVGADDGSSTVNLRGSASVQADENAYGTTRGGALSVNLAGDGSVHAETVTHPTVTAAVGAGTILTGDAFSLGALYHSSGKNNQATADATDGSLLGGGTETTAHVDLAPTVLSTIGSQAIIAVSGNLSVTASADNHAKSTAGAFTFGGIGAGLTRAENDVTGSTKALAQGAKTLWAGGDLRIDAGDSSNLDAHTNALGGGILGAGVAADSINDNTRTVEAHLGATQGTILGLGSVTVTAHADKEHAYGQSDGGAFSGGVSIGSNQVENTGKITVTASVDDNAAVYSQGAVAVSATGVETNEAHATASGGGALGGAVGASTTQSGTIDVEALLGKGVSLTGLSIDVGATSTNNATGDVDGTGGGVFAGVGSQVAQTDLYSTTIAKSGDSTAAHPGALHATQGATFHATGNEGGSSSTTGGAGGTIGAGGTENHFLIHAPLIAVAVGDHTTIDLGGDLTLLANDNATFSSSSDQSGGGLGASQDAYAEARLTDETIKADLGNNVTGSAANLVVHAWQSNVNVKSDATAKAFAAVAFAYAYTHADAYTNSLIHIKSGTNLTLSGGIDLDAFGPKNVFTDAYALAVTVLPNPLGTSATASSDRHTFCCVDIDSGVTFTVSGNVDIDAGGPAYNKDDNYNVDAAGDGFQPENGSNVDGPNCIENDAVINVQGGKKKKAKIGGDGSVGDLQGLVLTGPGGPIGVGGTISGPVTLDSLPSGVVMPTIRLTTLNGMTEGHSTIVYQASSDLEIENASPYAITLGNINLRDVAAPGVFQNAMDGEATWSFDLVGDSVGSKLTVTNTNERPTDIKIQGPILAPSTDVILSTYAGSILGNPISLSIGSPGGTFLVRSLDMSAPRGWVGTTTNPVAPQFAIVAGMPGGFTDVTGGLGVNLTPTFAALSGPADFSLGHIHALNGPVVVRVSDGRRLSLVERDGLQPIYTATDATFHVGDVGSDLTSVLIQFGPSESSASDVVLDGLVSAPNGSATVRTYRGTLTSEKGLVDAIRVELDGSSVGTADAPIQVVIEPSPTGPTRDGVPTAGLFGTATSGDFHVAATRGSLLVGRISADEGIVDLTTTDSPEGGEDILLPNGSAISSLRGEVLLNAGDNVFIAPDASIVAGRDVTIRDDFGNADRDGSWMWIDGSITTRDLLLLSGPDGDAIALRRVMPGTNVAMHAEGTDARYFIGSAATVFPSTDGTIPTRTGSTLDTIQGAITVDGRSADGRVGHVSLTIENDADRVGRSVAVDANVLTGLLGATTSPDALTIRSADIESLDLLLGTGDDVVRLNSIDPTTALTVEGGDGDDFFAVGSIGATKEGTPLPLIDGGLGWNTLEAPDSVNLWDLTGRNEGTVTGDNAFRFRLIQNLVGGEYDDIFRFEDRAGIDGSIDGVKGEDTLDYTPYTTPVRVDLREGTAAGVGGRVANIKKVIYPRA